jgi:hypothetical protein
VQEAALSQGVQHLFQLLVGIQHARLRE